MSFQCDVCSATQCFPALRASDFRLNDAREWDVVRCAQCGLAMLWPQPNFAELAPHYPDWLWREAAATRDAAAKWRLNLAAMARWKSPGDLLDVGTSTGEFLVAAARKGWRAHGLEISVAQVEVARENIARSAATDAHVETCSDFPAWQSAEKYDAVSFNHVLEHVPSPRAYLGKALEVMKPRGVLLISVPNWDSLSRRAFGRYWMHLDLPRHLFHFSPRTLTRLLDSLGCEVVELRFDDRAQDAAGLRQSAKRALKYGVLSRPIAAKIPAFETSDNAPNAARNVLNAFSTITATATEMLRVADTFRVVARRKIR